MFHGILTTIDSINISSDLIVVNDDPQCVMATIWVKDFDGGRMLDVPAPFCFVRRTFEESAPALWVHSKRVGEGRPTVVPAKAQPLRLGTSLA